MDTFSLILFTLATNLCLSGTINYKFLLIVSQRFQVLQNKFGYNADEILRNNVQKYVEHQSRAQLIKVHSLLLLLQAEFPSRTGGRNEFHFKSH